VCRPLILLAATDGGPCRVDHPDCASLPPAAPVSADSKPPDILDGTLSVGGGLQDDEAPRTSFFRRPTSLDRWFAWKRQLQENHGLNFGGSWGVLWQNYTNSAIAQPNSVGSKFTFNWSYDLFNRRKPSAFSFDMAIEDRRPLGTELPPLQAGIGAGSIVPTAATWGMFDLGITQA
jgi:porin